MYMYTHTIHIDSDIHVPCIDMYGHFFALRSGLILVLGMVDPDLAQLAVLPTTYETASV